MADRNNSNFQVPKFGWKVKFNHVFPEKWSDNHMPPWKQVIQLIPMVIRYIIYWLYMKCKGRLPLMDYVRPRNGKQMYGVPIGGIGGGTIGRGFKGEFCRFQLRPGIYQYKTIPGDQFIVTIKNKCGETVFQSILSPRVDNSTALSAWLYNIDSDNTQYTGLYPRSYYVYNIKQHGVILTCKQISPVIPNNYKDSCVPGAVFLWNVENQSEEEKQISLSFTFENETGEENSSGSGTRSEDFTDGHVSGVLLHNQVHNMSCTFAVSALVKPGVSVSKLTEWNPAGDGSEVWDQLYKYGRFGADAVSSPVTRTNDNLGCCVSCQSVVPSQSSSVFEFSLVWDMPEVYFGERAKSHVKYYTKFFTSAQQLSTYCLNNHARWDVLIDEWQSPVLDDEQLPAWYKSALFNETYYVSDGGSVWLLLDQQELDSLPADDIRREYGRFAYLEGHEYRMYNTYDVHFYASFALVRLWPKLQAVLQLDFNDTIGRRDGRRVWHWYDGSVTERKVKNSVPHDLGDPDEEPFAKINAYPVHDVSEWRDLDLKFVLQCYRDYCLTDDLTQLRSMWPNVCLLMDGALRWDVDGDGCIENSGSPDQTYDIWTMDGTSAYCGSLWLAALQCTLEMSKLFNDTVQHDKFKQILDKGKISWEEKLWNGSYYNFDSSQSSWSDSIMADQLCGLWYLNCCQLKNNVFREEYVKTALRTIYNNNVMKFRNGQSGAVNGMMPDGSVDKTAVQSEEVWTGVVYGLASLMIQEGMVKEGFQTAQGVCNVVYNEIGLGFETPEAIYEKKCYRSIGYMRPLSIWSMQLAWESLNRRK